MDKKAEAYDYIREEILSNRLQPGEPILELAISERLKMSRTPIREAMRKLESEGLVVSYPFRGVFVSGISPYDVDEIGELRILLEGWALKRSINRITESELDEIKANLNIGFQQRDWDRLHQADRALHGLIVAKAGSKRVQEFVHILNSQTERIRRLSARSENRVRRSYKEHIEIIEYIRIRDLEKSENALVRHLKSVSNSAVEVAKTYYVDDTVK